LHWNTLGEEMAIDHNSRRPYHYTTSLCNHPHNSASSSRPHRYSIWGWPCLRLRWSNTWPTHWSPPHWWTLGSQVSHLRLLHSPQFSCHLSWSRTEAWAPDTRTTNSGINPLWSLGICKSYSQWLITTRHCVIAIQCINCCLCHLP
jgi:hypothetical protein